MDRKNNDGIVSCVGRNSIAYRGDGEGGGASGHAAAPTAGVLRWRQVLSGDERSLRDLRHWLASLLPACPACDDVISVANEMANAIRHTASGRRGKFGVEITRHAAAVRVTVADGGAPAEPRLTDDPTAENGRGLLLVRGLSLHAGVIEASSAVSSGQRLPVTPRTHRSPCRTRTLARLAAALGEHPASIRFVASPTCWPGSGPPPTHGIEMHSIEN